MRKLNPETMKLEVGGGKEIAITEHSVWCVFQLPKAGGDPPPMTDEDARARRNELGQQICGSGYNPKVGIGIAHIKNGFKDKSITGVLGLKAFFLAAFQSLLFSNTDNYIRLEDVSNTEDLENIDNRNWCKAIVDNLSKAARLYKKDFAEKGINAPLTVCGIFLMMLYVDNLQHGLDINPFSLPRCAVLDTKTIDRISSSDRRGDIKTGTIVYGHLRLRSIIDTCYTPLLWFQQYRLHLQQLLLLILLKLLGLTMEVPLLLVLLPVALGHLMTPVVLLLSICSPQLPTATLALVLLASALLI